MLSRTVIKEVLDISIPAVAEATVYTLMAMLDTMIIGNYGGNKAVSAIGISNEILNTCVAIFITVGVSIGITSFVSRSIGARDIRDAEEYASLGFVIGLFVSIIICYSLFSFSEIILQIAGARGSVLSLSNRYTRITIIAIFFNMQINIINSILRGYGNTYTPFLVSLIVAAFKISLDLILIFGIIGAKMGVEGSAVASVISQAIGFTFLMFYLIYKSEVKIRLRYVLKLSSKKVKDLIFLVIPSSMEDAAFNLSRLLGTFIIMRAGTVSFAANQIANTVESISFMPGMGFGTAVTTLVGIKIGEKNYREAKEYSCACALGAVAMMSVFSVVFLIIPNFLVDLFVDENEKKVVYLASLCLFIGAFEQPAIALSSVFAGALKGSGDAKSPFIISLVTSWIIRVPLIFYFIRILKLSITYVWWVTVIQWTVDAILMFIFFEKRLNNLNRLRK
ncbi:MATE family efflux transporter [Clostridium sp. PL3]|uniref:Probable multidrug resistance protein NorM n=1 Tax=Clostridium thailandense TaxID=2794346 RepID=A0A949U487_9CLOT|nr:MATE family efflux transporter [Clostridium thailandense]MBV7276134.1 MATE family efflux transporter [Clostridium thailandense]